MFKVGDYVTKRNNPEAYNNDYINTCHKDNVAIPEGATGTIITCYDDAPQFQYLMVSWESAHAHENYGGTYRHGKYLHCYKILDCFLELKDRPTQEQQIIQKIKYLNQRKVLDKSKIIPPTGIYRGSSPSSKVLQISGGRENTTAIHQDSPIESSNRFLRGLAAVQSQYDFIGSADNPAVRSIHPAQYRVINYSGIPGEITSAASIQGTRT